MTKIVENFHIRYFWALRSREGCRRCPLVGTGGYLSCRRFLSVSRRVLGAAEDRAVAPASFRTILRLRSLIFYVADCAYKFIAFAADVQIDFLEC